MGRFRCTFVR